MSKLDPRSCFLGGSYQGLFDFRREFSPQFNQLAV